ncbi:MAG: hypothetical protein K0S94_2705 [Nitrospira sp.]|nr:hypothetical protein [Nitrospira sp.]
MNLDIRLPAEELAVAVDEGFPPVASREEDWNDAGTLGGQDDVRFLYRLVRGSFRYRMNHDHFDVWFDHVRYRVWARKSQGQEFVEGRCGHGDDPPKRLNLAARSALTWSDQWRLQSHTTFAEPVFVEPCQLAGLDLDVTPLLKAVLQPRLVALGQSIDRIIRRRTEAKQRAETVWQKLQEPIELSPNQWLVSNLSDARVGPITSNGTLFVKTSVNLVMEPKIVSGSKPEAVPTSLPPLQLAALPLEGFHLALPIALEYARINQRLEEEMLGQEFQTPLGDTLKVEGVQFYGSGDKLILALRVSGGVNGNLYATGTPVFEEGLGILRFVDLDFTVDTRNVLVRSANWMFHENILSSLKAHAVIDLSSQLQTLRSRLETALTRNLGPDARLQAEVLTLRPRGVYPTASGVEVHIIADGAMWVELR